MLAARIAVTAVMLATVGFSHAETVKPVPPEVLKQLETPAKIFVDGVTLHYDGIIIEQSVMEVERPAASS